MNLSTEKKTMDLENVFTVSKGKEKGVGWIGSLGLMDVNSCLWSGLAMRSCFVALGTTSSHLWLSMIMWENSMHTYMCNWVTMIYTRKKMYCWNNSKNKVKKILKITQDIETRNKQTKEWLPIEVGQEWDRRLVDGHQTDIDI